MLAGRKLSIVLILLGLAFIIEAPRYGFGTLAFPEPGLVPFMVAAVFLALEAVDLGISLSGPRPDKSQSPREKGVMWLRAVLGDPKTHFLLLTFGCFLLTYAVGLPAAIGVYATLSGKFLGLRSWWKNVVFGISLGVLIHYIFGVFFETELPSGWMASLMGG